MSSEYGALPRLEKNGLRDCQYNAEIKLEESFKSGKKKALAILATGSGKTYLACLASYRMLNYTINKSLSGYFLRKRNSIQISACKMQFCGYIKTGINLNNPGE